MVVKISGRLQRHGSTKRDHVKAAIHEVEGCETYPVRDSGYCGHMINSTPPCQGLNIKIRKITYNPGLLIKGLHDFKDVLKPHWERGRLARRLLFTSAQTSYPEDRSNNQSYA